MQTTRGANMTINESSPEIIVLKKIATAVVAGRNPLYTSIIAELCADFCGPQLLNLRTTFREPDSDLYKNQRAKIVKNTRALMLVLERAFRKLIAPPAKIEIQKGGFVLLTSEGQKLLDLLAKQKKNPA